MALAPPASITGPTSCHNLKRYILPHTSMAAPACWRCTGRALLRSSSRSRSSSVSRPSLPLPPPSIGLGLVAHRPLHTTPPLGKKPDPRKPTVHKPLNLKKNKKKVHIVVKKPEIGYRRALRKAIVLANSNAPVLDLPDLTAEDIVNPASVGKAFNINVEDLEKLRQLEVFQKKQLWQFFSRPTTFVRNESVGIARAMESVERYEVSAADIVDEYINAKFSPVEGVEESSTEEGRLTLGDAESEAASASAGENAEPLVTQEEIAENEADSELVAAVKLNLRKLTDDIALLDSQIDEARLANDSTEKLSRKKQNLEKFISRLTPQLRYLAKKEQRKLERQEKQKSTQPATLSDFEALLRKRELSAESKKIQQGERAQARKESQENSSRRMANYIITGKAGTGKSILLLQAIIAAIQRSWVVIPIANAHDIVIGTTAYELDANTGRFIQRNYIRNLLARIGKANANVLMKTTIKDDIRVGTVEIKAGSSLISIIEAGTSGPEHSHEAFMALLKQLEQPGRPPVLFTMDNLDYAVRSACGYKSPEFEDLHPLDLEILHTFAEYMSGRRKFVRLPPTFKCKNTKLTKSTTQSRQMILAATTSELHPNPSLELIMQNKPLPGIGKYDHRVAAALGTAATTIVMRGLSREHTRNFLEFYKRCGLWDYAWARSVPISPALEKAGITSQEYMKLTGIEDFDAPRLSAVEEEPANEPPPSAVSLTEMQDVLALQQRDREKATAVERQKLVAEYLALPPTDYEVTERHILTGGVPRELLKHCLRVQGSLNMP
ncbi:37S ribosomal protein S23 [Drechslerella dactyloides]|uniref:Small ribosomal subunit protein mS29 n=1 Tax=Drechslerella dactyloides TaxID=74499 RepID=A0AAD6J0F6_DREDA|nr:37S ribosomal protein S23 [Drechslerella dactyloides]